MTFKKSTLYAPSWVYTHNKQRYTKALWALLSLSLFSMGGLKAMNHMKDVAAPEMFPWASLEKRAVC